MKLVIGLSLVNVLAALMSLAVLIRVVGQPPPAPVTTYVNGFKPIYHDQATFKDDWLAGFPAMAYTVHERIPQRAHSVGDASILSVDLQGYVLARCIP